MERLLPLLPFFFSLFWLYALWAKINTLYNQKCRSKYVEMANHISVQKFHFFLFVAIAAFFSHSFEECFAGGGKVVYACEERCRAKTGIPISDRLIKMPKKKYFSTYAYDGVSTICRILFSYNV